MKTLIQIFAFISLLAMASFGQTQYSILIDPGHGGAAPGAIGADGKKEKDITLKLGNDLRTYLVDNNITPSLRTYMTRKTDVDVSFANRANMAKGLVKDAYWVAFPRNGDNTKDGVDFFFSIHCNAGTTTSKGTLGLIYDDINDATPTNKNTNDYKFAKTVVSEYVTSTKTVFTDASIRTSQYSPDGVGGRNNIDILTLTAGAKKNVGFPRAVSLLETEFVSNPTTWSWLQNTSYQSKAVIGMAEGIKKAKSGLTTVGVEDYIYFYPPGPTYFTQNSSLTYSANFVDEYPYGDYIVGNFSWSLLIEHQEGDYIATTGTTSTIQSWQFTFGTLPYGYYWLRDGSGNVKGRVKVTGTDNGGITHTAYYNIAVGGVPNNTTSGTLTHNETWGGENLITGSITVPSNITLNILPNANIKFSNNASLIVYGTLNATNATFTSLSGSVPGSWGSIILDGSGASGSIFNGVTVQYGTEIKANNVPSFTVNNSTIENMINGVNAYNSNGWVMNSVITTPRDHGIVANNSTIACYHNTISKSDHSGAGILYTAGGGDYIWNNDISGFDWGVGSIYGSFPYFGHPSNTGVNNHIQNCLEGIRAFQYSGVYMGDDDPSFTTYGYSSFLNTNTLHAKVYDYSDVFATYNYWGQYPPSSSKFSIYNGGTMDYSSALSSDPWLPSLALTINPGKISTSQIMSTQLQVQTSHPFKRAMKLRKENKYVEALESLKETIAKDEYVSHALLAIASLHNDTLGTIVEDFLSQFPVDKSPLGAYLYGNILAKKQRNNDAIASFSKILQTSSFAKASKLSEFYINLYNAKNSSRAQEILTELIKTKSENDFAVTLAQHDYAVTTKDNAIGNDPIKNTRATDLSQSQNYPNPFNPSTTISYTISEASNVELKVYDYLGREVTTLVNGYKTAGEYFVNFDAGRLASGVYFYKIKIGNNVATKKMLLTK